MLSICTSAVGSGRTSNGDAVHLPRGVSILDTDPHGHTWLRSKVLRKDCEDLGKVKWQSGSHRFQNSCIMGGGEVELKFVILENKGI